MDSGAVTLPKTLFVGLGVNRVVHYRVVLPAMYLGQDWVGVDGAPPYVRTLSSYVGNSSVSPDYESYDVVVLQQPRGQGWFKFIKSLQARGVKVLYEIDDYVHGIRKISGGHDFAQWFQPKHLKQMELCMRVCDGGIVSTEYLAQRYSSLIRGPIHVCENGLDLPRYAYVRPPRPELNGRPRVTILWAGATGHTTAVGGWLDAVKDVMRTRPNVRFLSIGQGFASLLLEEFGDERCVSIPFSPLDTYPAAMTGGDISLAPAGKSAWHRAKSDLRALESAALGLPIIADAHYAESIDHMGTGFIVDEQTSVHSCLEMLIDSDELRVTMGANCRTRAAHDFSIVHRVPAWAEALRKTADS